MKISVELTELDMRRILANHINENYEIGIKPEELNIEVKSKQNYRSEWELATFRLQVDINR